MALFGSKKKATEKSAKKTAAPAKTQTSSSGVSVSRDVIKHARITEKASEKQMAGVYVFNIMENATKRDIIRSIQALYQVTPRKIAIVNTSAKIKRNMRTGRTGTRGGGKKAYVYLKSGETITL